MIYSRVTPQDVLSAAQTHSDLFRVFKPRIWMEYYDLNHKAFCSCPLAVLAAAVNTPVMTRDTIARLYLPIQGWDWFSRVESILRLPNFYVRAYAHGVDSNEDADYTLFGESLDDYQFGFADGRAMRQVLNRIGWRI